MNVFCIQHDRMQLMIEHMEEGARVLLCPICDQDKLEEVEKNREALYHLANG